MLLHMVGAYRVAWAHGQQGAGGRLPPGAVPAGTSKGPLRGRGYGRALGTEVPSARVRALPPRPTTLGEHMQRTSRLGLIGASTAALAISILAVAPVSARPNPELASHVHFMPTKAAAAQAAPHGDAKPGGGGGGGTQAGIYYHGGRVASTGSAAFHVESIYWGAGTIYPGGPNAGTGDTTGTATQDGSLVGTYLRSLGGTPYYRINQGYWDNLGAGGALRYVSGAVTYDGYWADGSSAPSGTQNISDQAVINEITSGFSSGRITYHPDTIYAVFSAGGVNLGGGAFSQYCAYHGNFQYNGQDVIYAVMPYNAYSTSCEAQTTGPNNDPADAEVNTLTHEIEEANTDPDLNAWYDRRGYENADKCAWTFGTTHTATNGALYNVTFGGHNWLIQRQWKNSGRGSCALS